MKRTDAGFRGQPLLLLALLVGGWVMVRAAFWESPFAVPAVEFGPLPAPQLALVAQVPDRDADPAPRIQPAHPLAIPPSTATTVQRMTGTRPYAGDELPDLRSIDGPASVPIPAAKLAAGPAPARLMPAGILRASRSPSPRRLTADGWVLLRSGGENGELRPGYGRSQAGAVLRYRLGAGTGRRPQLHLRASTALAGGTEREAAAGVSARPIAHVPVRLAAELRATRSGPDDTYLRPAAFAVTEFAPIALPLAGQAELCLQAGYVGGKFATAFIDGQARAERDVARIGRARLSAGTAAWGGAQRGAGRLDIGPSASLLFPVGPVDARLSLDYRVRMAGAAAPASGPALSLSAGF